MRRAISSQLAALRVLTLGVLGILMLGAQAPAGYTNSVGMEFVLVHPGEMTVGVYQPYCMPVAEDQLAAARAHSDPRVAWTEGDYQNCLKMAAEAARPGFQVALRQPYYIGKYEVTQAQWRQVMGNNPSVFQTPKISDGDLHPVDSVTWSEAVEFIRKLNALEHTRRYRLPTEFEWEYACRAGGSGQQSWPAVRQMAAQGVADPTTRAVGTKRPNAWGIYDMLGNVWEWVADPYNYKMFPDPTPPASGPVHVLKGGGFASDVKNTICATHDAGPGDGWDVGFRVESDVQP